MRSYVFCCLFLYLLSAYSVHAEIKAVDVDQRFEQWLEQFSERAVNNGIRKETISSAFRNVTYDRKVIRLDRNQPEFTQTLDVYLEKRLTYLQIKRGKRRIAQNRALLDRISKTYQVDSEVIAAIWGIESNFGTYLPKFDAMQTLATLAFDPRRSHYFQTELLAALQILDSHKVRRAWMKGSYSGALGQPQFMPSTYLRISQDFDQDGVRDIWKSNADVLASIAEYLRRVGRWHFDVPWGLSLESTMTLDVTAYRGQTMLLKEWSTKGVSIPKGFLELWQDQSAKLLIPKRSNSKAFLVMHNFMAIMEYNPSHFYALAVCLLSDELM